MMKRILFVKWNFFPSCDLGHLFFSVTSGTWCSLAASFYSISYELDAAENLPLTFH